MKSAPKRLNHHSDARKQNLYVDGSTARRLEVAPQKQKGISFLLVYFSTIDSFYFLPFETLEKYWTEAQQGGRKSIPLSAFEEQYRIVQKKGILQYLETINTYLINQE